MTPPQRAIYERLLAAARAVGPFREDPKKTSIHLTRRSAFAGVAARKDALVVTIKLPADVQSPRVVKRERTSPAPVARGGAAGVSRGRRSRGASVAEDGDGSELLTREVRR